jgi:DNA (cytosine-5)-methyltransferase 1
VNWKHISLFTGIGGLDLAAEWAGFKTVLQVEMDDYANKVLEKHWPNVKRIKDVKDVTGKEIEGEITLLSGGFPCQPFSSSGRRGGRGDDRYLWPEMLRVVRLYKPRFVVGENVSGLISINAGMEIESIITDLESENYEVWAGIIPACGVGAHHRRERIFIVANSNSVRMERKGSEQQTAGSRGESQNVADTEEVLSQRFYGRQGQEQSRRSSWWEIEPDVGRVADGIPNRIHRLRCLGNAVVPQQAYPIFKALGEIIKTGKKNEVYLERL